MRAGRVPVLPYALPAASRLGQWLAESQATEGRLLAEPRRCRIRGRFLGRWAPWKSWKRTAAFGCLAGGHGRLLDDCEVAELLGRQM